MKPIDISAYRKSLTKAIPGISAGFNDPIKWMHTGSYVLDYLVCGRFIGGGIPLEGKVTMFAGAPGSGKSYIVSGNLTKYCQHNDIFPIIIDTENALDTDWLVSLGVDTSDDKMLKLSMSDIDEVGLTLSTFIKDYKAKYGDLPKSEKPYVLFIIDSLGMLLTPNDKTQFETGDMKGDMGRKAKMLYALMRNLLSQIASENIGVVCTNHIYDSQDQYNPDPKLSGGKGAVFASSIIITMNQLKLKEDEDGNKLKEVMGIRSSVKVIKTRYSKPFEDLEIRIPWDSGMDPYSGLFTLFTKKNVLEKIGNRYKWVSSQDGTEIFKFRKDFTHEDFDRIMLEFKEEKITHIPEDVDEPEVEMENTDD
jgi:recombination protein RecA